MTGTADTIESTTSAESPFSRSLLVLLISWLAGLMVTWLAVDGQWLGLDERLDGRLDERLDGGMLWMIGIASGLIAIAATLPSVVLERKSGSAGDGSTVTVGIFAAVAIRLLGTVALAALCSYQMPAAKGWIAGVTIGWYAYLLVVDVLTLSTLLSRRDRVTFSRSSNAKPSVQ